MAHKHEMRNADPHFKIDPDTRALQHTSPEKLTIMQGDHNSEIISFDMPRFIDGHDMALCNRIQIQYINIDTTFSSAYLTGVYEVTDKEIKVDDDGNEIIVFSWPVSGNATSYVGPLNFGIRFCCITNSVIEYSWHTAICKQITIAKSFNNNEEFIEQNIDTLSEWEAKINSFENELGMLGPAIDAIIAAQAKLLNLITFNIDDVILYARAGMSWAEWITSVYNTIGVTVYSNEYSVLVTCNGKVITSPYPGMTWQEDYYFIEEGKHYYLGEEVRL